VSDRQEPEIVPVPNTLRMKAAMAGGMTGGEMLRRAEQAIAADAASYGDGLKDEIDMLAAVVDAAAGAQSLQLLDPVFGKALELEGVAGAYGYGLVTLVAGSLRKAVDGMQRGGKVLPEVMKVHVESLRLILAEGIVGEGGANGRTMLAALKALREKTVGADEE